MSRSNSSFDEHTNLSKPASARYFSESKGSSKESRRLLSDSDSNFSAEGDDDQTILSVSPRCDMSSKVSFSNTLTHGSLDVAAAFGSKDQKKTNKNIDPKSSVVPLSNSSFSHHSGNEHSNVSDERPRLLNRISSRKTTSGRVTGVCSRRDSTASVKNVSFDPSVCSTLHVLSQTPPDNETSKQVFNIIPSIKGTDTKCDSTDGNDHMGDNTATGGTTGVFVSTDREEDGTSSALLSGTMSRTEGVILASNPFVNKAEVIRRNELELERKAKVEHFRIQKLSILGLYDPRRIYYKYLYYGLIPQGSILSAVFSIATGTMGGGTIALPGAFLCGGGIFGFIFLVFIGLLSVYASRLLVSAKEITGQNSYEELARHLVSPVFEKVVTFAMICLCWAVCVLYIVAIGDILDPIREMSLFPDVFQGAWGRRLLTTLFWFFSMFPLSLMRKINSFRYVSMSGFLSAVFLVLVVIVFSFSEEGVKEGTSHANIPILRDFQTTMISLSIFVFSCGCQLTTFIAYEGMHDRTINKLTSAELISMTCVIIIYCTFGYTALSVFGERTQPNILKNFESYTNIWYVALAYVGICLTLTTAYPMIVFPMRSSILQMMGYRTIDSCPTYILVPLSGSLAVSSMLAAMFIPGIDALFGVLGGVLGSFMLFICPSFFIIRTRLWTIEKAGLLNVIATWFMFIFGIFSAIFSTTQSILSLV
eukprot:Tbor_TRINITY_DN5224_c0_g1::TRINITY_DN5224_c0_g1_i2::g.16198::m.16198/K14996/SLC38A10; solute carrier family 38 (sodium-coupled neutral amino acid transporter), member 10